MKKFLLGSLFLCLLLIPSASAEAVYVSGYYRSNGTYVQGYNRTAADGNPYNNYSYPGNYNPNTGKVTGGSTATYLNNYYNNSSGSTYSPSSYTYYPTTPTCPLNSYASGSSCKCSYGYVASGGSCVSANNLCHTQLGIMSSYDSLSGSCKCDYGYVIGTFGTCTYKPTTYSTYSPTTYSYGATSSSCPAHSSQSLSNIDKCTCDAGYAVNKSKDRCVAIPFKSNDEICQDSFGSRSIWSGSMGSSNTPTCICKDNYEWSKNGKSCVKSKS